MANWANNTIKLLSGQIEEVVALFRELERQEEETGFGVTPEGWRETNYMHNLSVSEDEGIYYINYETKWNPNFMLVDELIERYNIHFNFYVECLEDNLYGELIYKSGQKTLEFYIPDIVWNMVDWDLGIIEEMDFYDFFDLILERQKVYDLKSDEELISIYKKVSDIKSFVLVTGLEIDTIKGKKLILRMNGNDIKLN